MMRLVKISALLLITTGNAYAEGSGEAILRGLEKAAAREAENHQVEDATEAGEGRETSDDRGYVSRAFVCKNTAGVVRHIKVEHPGPESGYACRVLYETEYGSQVPWNARNQQEYCESHAVRLVKKLMDANWNCAEQ